MMDIISEIIKEPEKIANSYPTRNIPTTKNKENNKRKKSYRDITYHLKTSKIEISIPKKITVN